MGIETKNMIIGLIYYWNFAARVQEKVKLLQVSRNRAGEHTGKSAYKH